jgi:ABC-type transporter Mla maintaining outer membrane lipid asymmetry ATPase subunit MlaF
MTPPKLILLDGPSQGPDPVLARETLDTGFRSLKPFA